MATFSKIKSETRNNFYENIEKIADLFPHCVTELLNEEGKVHRSVDFDMLRQELGSVVEGQAERYSFTWPNKKKAIVLSNMPSQMTLRPVREKSVDFENTKNIFIEGDNLSVLKCLREAYLGKVKMIYIDPPYNTGGDFIYSDNFLSAKEAYFENSGQVDGEGGKLVANMEVNGRFHTDWLNMMYPRLKVARDLLSDDGIIMMSIDYNENFNLRAIANEIFGGVNFLGEIYWESKTKSQNTSTAYNKLQPKVEVILVYAKNQRKQFNLVSLGAREYSFQDDRGPYREHILEEMSSLGVRGRETMVYPIVCGKEVISPREGFQWQIGKSVINEYLNKGDLFFRDGKVVIKMRPEYERSEKNEPFWGLIDKKIGTAESAKADLKKLMGGSVFDTVKPVELIKKLVFHVTDPNDIVLDFFAGSGTTGHAVMQQNAEDGGNRQFILVQIEEEVTAEDVVPYTLGYRNLAEVTRERLVRSGNAVKDQSGMYGQNLDIGFRVFRLDSSNMNDVQKTPEAVVQEDLFSAVDNVKIDRTPEDLLIQVMLALGITLEGKIQRQKIAEKDVYIVEDGFLIACFDNDVTDDVVEAIAKEQPTFAVLRDACFKEDSVADNFEQIFKTYAPNTVCKVI